MSEDTRPLMVTIQCFTYNHEAYIRQCLNGFIIQETDFRFEAVVHDDASTDGTAAIIREYAEKYPDVIRPIYETENQYSKRDGSLQRIMNSNCHGKYIACCEGDDYWTDPLKLQKQVDFMELHPECSLMLSNGEGYYSDIDRFILLNPIPVTESRYLTMNEVLLEKGGLIPTASMCLRREMIETEPKWCLNAPVGDRPLRMWCAINGRVYYDITPMVVYRKSSLGSFTQQVNTDHVYARCVLDGMIAFYDAFDINTHYEYHDSIQYIKDREEYSFFCRISDYSSKYINAYFKRFPLSMQYRIKIVDKLKQTAPQLYKFLQKLYS